MALNSTETWGMLCLILQGLLVTITFSLSKILKEWQWPYFRIMAITHIMIAVGIALGLGISQFKLPDHKLWKWVLLRSIFGTAAFVLQILATQAGVGTGDVASLTSINTVVAALMGRVFLGEDLRPLHAISLCFTIGGTVLIAQPKFIFGGAGSDVSSTSGVGCSLAILSGFCYASSFIISRKVAAASPWILTMVDVLMSSIYFLILPCIGLVEDYSLTSPMQDIRLAFVIFKAILVLNLSGWLSLCAGSMWCPAVISSITSLTARMVFGYLAQMLFFGAVPKVVTLVGAGSMFAGVTTVVLLKIDTGSASAPSEGQETAPSTTTFPNQSLLRPNESLSSNLARNTAATRQR